MDEETMIRYRITRDYETRYLLNSASERVLALVSRIVLGGEPAAKCVEEACEVGAANLAPNAPNRSILLRLAGKEP